MAYNGTKVKNVKSFVGECLLHNPFHSNVHRVFEIENKIGGAGLGGHIPYPRGGRQTIRFLLGFDQTEIDNLSLIKKCKSL